MTQTLKTTTLLILSGLLIAGCTTSGNIDNSPLVYELRTYTANDGKLPALHDRFRNHTMTMFEKHGIKNVAYWTPTEKPNTLVYLIAHSSKQAAENSWKAFVADPAWQAVYAASIADGRLVANIDSVFMSSTDYSPALN